MPRLKEGVKEDIDRYVISKVEVADYRGVFYFSRKLVLDPSKRFFDRNSSSFCSTG